MSFIKINRGDKEKNPASKFYLIGVLIGVLAFVLGYFGYKQNNVLLLGMFLILLICGILIMTYGNTKFRFKGNVNYQEFIQKSNKRDLILLPAFIIIMLLSLVAYALFQSLIVFLIIFSIGLIILIFMLATFWITFLKSWDVIKKEWKKVNKK